MGDRIEPVGLVEIAERLGVTANTAYSWHWRSTSDNPSALPLNEPMPAPRWTVGGRPAWNWADVERWARRTGRLDAVTT